MCANFVSVHIFHSVSSVARVESAACLPLSSYTRDSMLLHSLPTLISIQQPIFHDSCTHPFIHAISPSAGLPPPPPLFRLVLILFLSHLSSGSSWSCFLPRLLPLCQSSVSHLSVSLHGSFLAAVASHDPSTLVMVRQPASLANRQAGSQLVSGLASWFLGQTDSQGSFMCSLHPT